MLRIANHVWRSNLKMESAMRSRCLFVIVIATLSLAFQGCHMTQPNAKVSRQASVEPLGGSAVVIETRNGGVDIQVDPSLQEISIAADMTSVGSTQKEADERAAQAAIDWSRDTKGALTIRPLFAGGERSGDGARFTVKLPSV